MEKTYRAFSDTDSDNPLDWADACKLFVYRADRSRGVEHGAPNGTIAAFLHAFGMGHDEALSLKVAQRYARMIEPESLPVIQEAWRGYAQSDWADVIVTGEYAESVYRSWAQWMRGDVWTVCEYETEECDKGETHETLTDSLSGIYADSEEEAIAYYRDNH